MTNPFIEPIKARRGRVGRPAERDGLVAMEARRELLAIAISMAGRSNLRWQISRICARLTGSQWRRLPWFYKMKMLRSRRREGAAARTRTAHPFAATLEKDLRRALAEKPMAWALERAEIMAGLRPAPAWLDISNWTSPFDPTPRKK